MTKPANPQSLKRFSDSLASLFKETKSEKTDLLFIKSSSDHGVERNGGRNGARFAPQSLLTSFKRLTKSAPWNEMTIQEVEVASYAEEIKDFKLAQKNQEQKIFDHLASLPHPSICHIGGGHDHVFPLLSALSQKYEQVIVINIDAHADTRTDEEANSGTPFRQFATLNPKRFQLFQIGLHPFANSDSTLSPLPSPMYVLWRNELTKNKLDDFFTKIQTYVTPKTVVVFSLDADALHGSEMGAVSAVNGDGLSMKELEDLWQRYKQLKVTHQPVMGIYELNPVYDSLSALSMRVISTFLYKSLV